MLESVTVKNLALIDEIEVDLGEGLNVITGPTGSGKTLLLRALRLSLGARADYDLLPSGDQPAVVSVFFNPEAELNLPCGLGKAEEIHCRRVLKNSRKSPAYLNGERVRLKSLQKLRRDLIDFHGQHENQNVFSAAYPRIVLDKFGGHEEVLKEYKEIFEQYREVREKIEKLKNRREKADKEKQLLEYQIEELEEFSPAEGEWQEIEDERRQMENFEDIDRCVRESLGRLEAEGGLTDGLKLLQDNLRTITEQTNELEDWPDELSEMDKKLEEYRQRLREFREGISFSGHQYEQLLKRRGKWLELSRKYKVAPEALFIHYRELREELDQLAKIEERLKVLGERREELEDKVRSRAGELSRCRGEAAKRLEKKIVKRLQVLDLEKAEFRVEVTQVEPGPEGADEVKWLFSSHSSEPPAELASRISGGEISRVLLAVKAALAAADTTPVLVFDEIDVGISGEEARSVGKVLSELARYHQVICITHLPLVSVFADRHLAIEREDREEDVEIKARTLEGEERLDEICRLLSGDAESQVSRQQAQELLEEVKKDG